MKRIVFALSLLNAIAIAGCDPHSTPIPSPTLSPCQQIALEFPSGTAISCETAPFVSGSPTPIATPTPLPI